MTTNHHTPYADGVTTYRAADMNPPLASLDAAITDLVESVGGGSVTGPVSSTDNAVSRFDGVAGDTIQDSLVSIDDSGSVNIPEGQAYKINGSAHAHALDGGVGISFEATAKPASGGEYSFILPYGMTVPANCSGSGFYNKTNPGAQIVVSIKKNGTQFATLTVATNGTPTWASSSAAFASGDRVSFVFPAQDAVWAGVVITVKGARSVS